MGHDGDVLGCYGMGIEGDVLGWPGGDLLPLSPCWQLLGLLAAWCWGNGSSWVEVRIG